MMLAQQRIRSRVASAVISPSYRGKRCSSRVGFNFNFFLFENITTKASSRPLASLALFLTASPEKRQFQHGASLQLPWSGFAAKGNHATLIGIDGRQYPWFNNLIQLRHHSSSSARGRGGRGHQDYTQVGGPIDKSVCDLSESEIHNLLRARSEFKRKRDFQRADIIQEQLRRCGVKFDDRAKTWRADGKLFMPKMSDCQSMEEAIKAIHDNLEKASPRDMSSFWAVVPKLLNSQQGRSQKQPLVPQLNAIFVKTADRLGNYGARDLVTTALAFAKIIKILEKGRGRHARGSYEEFLHGILVGRKEVIFKFIGKSTIPTLSKFDARHISNLAYACALAGNLPKFEDGSTLFHHLAERSMPLVGRFEPQHLSNTVWAFAKAEISHPLMFEKVANRIVELDHLDAFNPQELANSVWAFATAAVSHPPLFEKVADHIVGLDHLDEFKPQDFANIVGAFVKAGESHPPLFETVASCIVRLDHLGAFKTQELANTIWAYAKAEVSHPSLFEKVAEHIVRLDHLGAFNPQNLSNMVWAFAKSEMSHPPLFERAADHIAALDNLTAYDPQALANIVWAFTTADMMHPPLFERVADHIVGLDNLEKFSPQALANIVWAFAKAEVSHPGLFDKIAHHIVSLDNLEDFIQQGISNLIWGFAKADVRNPDLFDKLADVALDKEDEFTARDISNILRWTKQ